MPDNVGALGRVQLQAPGANELHCLFGGAAPSLEDKWYKLLPEGG